MSKTSKPRPILLADLAAALGCSPKSLRAWRKLPDAPKPKRNGDHDLDAWQAFVSNRGLGKRDTAATDPELRRRKLQAETELREIKVGTLRGELIPRAEVRERIGFHIGQTQMLLRRKLEDELPVALMTMKSAAEARGFIARVLNDCFVLLSRGQYPETPEAEARLQK